MRISDEDWDQIKKIVAAMDCPKTFRCYKSGFKNLCPVEAFPGDKVVECRKTGHPDCLMAFRFGHSRVFCRCPLRQYIALHLGI